MTKISKLTPAQTARFPEFVERWTKIGLCTDPADRPRAEDAIRQMYRCGGLEPPKQIVWCGSPLTQGLTRAIILDGKTGASVRASVGASVRDSVRASVWDSVGDSVEASVWNSVYGQHDASWLAFYDFFAEACGLSNQTSRLSGLLLLAQSAGWALPHQNICWVSERHHILQRDAQGRLHCLSGPAVAYPDGWAIYAVHGVRVPEYIIERPSEIDIAKIDAQNNAEIRRVMIDRYRHGEEINGAGAYLRDSHAKRIDHDEQFGTLYRREIPGDEPIVMVEVVNRSPEPDGRFRHYMLRVPPDMTTAHEAVAWTFGKTPQTYRPMVES